MLRCLSEASGLAGSWVLGGSCRGLKRWQQLLPCHPVESAAASFMTSSVSSDEAAAQPAPQLTDEQKQQLSSLLLLMNQPAAGSIKAATTIAKAVTMRDMYVVMDQLFQRDNWQNPHPLARESRRAAQLAQLERHATSGGSDRSSSSSSSGVLQPRGTRLSFPIYDVTKLPDTPDDSLNLRQEFMNSPLCWMQLLPNHLEVSYSLVTGIYLWPPQEIFYPEFFDFDLIHRHIQRRLKGRRRKPGPKRSRR